MEAMDLVLAQPDKPITQIAALHGRCRKRLGKLVAISCLAPDIVTAILQGQQPRTLTAQKLLDADLPLRRDEQRKVLGFG
jgi:site-specific DNA recombinase